MQNQDVRHQNPRLFKQSGNALWFILVAIGLLAALTLTMTRNSGKVADNLDEEQVKIVAERIARDISGIGAAVQRLKMANGCSDEEISFDNKTLQDLSAGMAVNPKSPTTGSRAYTCHLYDARGGGLTYAKLPAGINTEEGIIITGANMMRFWGHNSIPGVGPEGATETLCSSNCSELIVGIVGVDEKICAAYNKLAKINGVPEDDDGYDDTFFVGTYGAGTASSAKINIAPHNATSALYGVKTGCFYSSNSAFYDHVIYGVLIAR